MTETKNRNIFNKTYVLKRETLTDIVQFFLHIFDSVFNFFSLRQTKQYWGMVYDAVTKQPLDPVIVKLLYTDGREVETVVTDLGGRYGFLAKPGKFKIYTRKTNYSFPSKYVLGSEDGIYQNLYHGEFFILDEASEVVGPNIPMDPEKFDWNQQAKQKLMKTHPYSKKLWKKLLAVFFWFGLVFNVLFLWVFIKHIPPILYFTLAFYFLIVLFANFLPEARLWGRAIFNDLSISSERLYLELHSPLFAGVCFGKSSVHENGRFLLRAGKGIYTLTVSYFDDNREKVFLCSSKVRIGGTGVLSSTIRIILSTT